MEKKESFYEITIPNKASIIKLNLPKDKHFDHYQFEVCERLDEFWIFFKKNKKRN